LETICSAPAIIGEDDIHMCKVASVLLRSLWPFEFVKKCDPAN
jgi:hypothetical protein